MRAGSLGFVAGIMAAFVNLHVGRGSKTCKTNAKIRKNTYQSVRS
jgi:hypothetical protein